MGTEINPTLIADIEEAVANPGSRDAQRGRLVHKPEEADPGLLTVERADIILEMRKVHAVQSSHGNWNHDAYMLGMFNGMELMLSIAEGRSPVYRDAPKKFLADFDTKELEKVFPSATEEGVVPGEAPAETPA